MTWPLCRSQDVARWRGSSASTCRRPDRTDPGAEDRAHQALVAFAQRGLQANRSAQMLAALALAANRIPGLEEQAAEAAWTAVEQGVHSAYLRTGRLEKASRLVERLPRFRVLAGVLAAAHERRRG